MKSKRIYLMLEVVMAMGGRALMIVVFGICSKDVSGLRKKRKKKRRRREEKRVE